jgi:proteasome lid subunit RPN8/RPN11
MTSWQTPLCPFTIGFTAEKLDEIRIAVVDGFYAVPRGGVEIGGVLYGKRMEGWLLITDYQKIETEYLTGPSFHLSENDEAGLRKVLAETTFEDPQIIPVGWFHSHTRSEICLSEKDLKVFQDFFPEPWQVALVLKPESLGPVRGGYFFRNGGGVVKADASAMEFTLVPYFGEKQTAKVAGARVVEPAHVPEVRAEAVPVSEVVATEPQLFQSITPGSSEAASIKKRVIWGLLAAAVVVSAVAGYWVATH